MSAAVLDRFAAALSPRLAGAALVEALGWPAMPCQVLDAKIEYGTSATVLYELGGHWVVAASCAGDPGGTTGGAGTPVSSLGLVARVFPDDPALPALAGLMDPAGMAETLTAGLRDVPAGSRVLGCKVRPVRYRPGRRATLRVDAVVRSGGEARRRTYFAKIYHDGAKAAAVHAVMEGLSGSAAVRHGRVRLPAVAAYCPDVPMIVQEPVAGTALDLLIGPLRPGALRPEPRGVAGVLAAADALAAVHESPARGGKDRPLAREAVRMLGRARAVGNVDPSLGAAMAEAAQRLAAAADGLPQVTGGVHGDCKPSQFLVGAGPPAMLDFDHAGPADPATDVGTFAATLVQLGAWQALVTGGGTEAAVRSAWLADLERAFVRRYAKAAPGGPQLSARVDCQVVAALLRKALRGAARSPRSPLPKALTELALSRLAAVQAPAVRPRP